VARNPLLLEKKGGAGGDPDAIHDNVASEISAITEKVTPVDADLIVIEDSAAGNAKKRVQVSNLKTPLAAVLYSIIQYAFAPDAAPGVAITASTTDPQGLIHHSGPASETAVKFWVDAETAPGTNAVLKVKYADIDTLDGTPSWTEIATLTLTDKGISTTSMTNAAIPADRLVALFVDSISGTGPKDVTCTLRAKRPLST